jgi:UDP-3-O-[3-hydroxymyristoyl] glucosamine N-acyltransferase
VFTLGELAAKLGLDLSGLESRPVTGLASLTSAGPAHLSFFSESKYLPQLADTGAAAVILSAEYSAQCPVDHLVADDPYLAFAEATALFDNSPRFRGIHPSATISPDSDIHESVSIGPNAIVEDGVCLAEHVLVEAGAFIGRDSKIGAGTRIHPNVVIYHDVHLGAGCEIHSSSVLGSDGFGYARGESGWVKIYQLGGVRIGDRVQIGAGATIDRGALEHTVIHDGAILDNQVHIAHNCSIGKNTAIAACCGVAGSTKIGANCTFGGMVGVTGHIEICDNAHFSAKAMVMGSVREPGNYSSGTKIMPSQEWRKNAVRFGHLDTMYKRLGKLEKSQKT